MAIDYSLSKFSKGTPRKLEAHHKETEHDRKLARAYAQVDTRDDSICWVTGVKLAAVSASKKLRREHHHLKGRNVRPEWVFVARRIITVSTEVHEYLTSNTLLADGCDAWKPIKFSWNQRIVKPGKQPFRLRPEIAKAAA